MTRGFIGRLKIPDSTPDPTISKLATVAKLTFLNTPNSRDSSLAPQELSVFTPDVRRVQRLHSRTPSEVLRVQDAPRAGGVSVSTHSLAPSWKGLPWLQT